jgi:Lar family restriction alleviation protein
VEELRECPFCGETEFSLLNGEEGTTFIECPTCLVRSDSFECQKKLIKFWNKRYYIELKLDKTLGE